MHQRCRWMPLGALLLGLGLGPGCGDDDGGSEERPEQTGAACEAAEDCYPDLDVEELAGDPRCLTRVRDGYCTHLCEVDDDCCAVEGECVTDFRQVCAPFESTGENVCFLSCEPDALPTVDGGVVDDQAFCQREAGPDFVCRSTGGGAENRQVCVPGACGVGAGCAGDEDCGPDLTCVTDVQGGYCTVTDCNGDADCPMNSVCATVDGTNLCLRSCTAETDCSFCRDPDVAATCTMDVNLVESSDVTVCDPPG